MAGIRQHGLDDHRSEFGQIISEAKHRWLRAAEICKLLRNHTSLTLSDEPANMPESGSLFLYDRKVLRHFRKDGHRWKKTRDGRAVKEAHETLKDEGVIVLHCYYAHGEENGNFQRRSYWMLEQDLSHIALVHYREVESNRTNNHVEKIEEVVPYSIETEELAPNPEMQNPISSSFNPCNFQMHSQATDATILKTAQASELKNPESGACWQTSERTLSSSFNWPMDQSLHSNREYEVSTRFHEEVDAADLFKSMGPCHMDSDIQNDCSTQTNNDTISKRNNTIDGNADHPSVINPQSDNQQIFSEAKHRWLRPAEIYEILQNNKNFHISSEPANRPPGGNLFLYDRNVRFRNDGHRWKKTRDGKVVKEGHEKLKVGSVDVLHCYYAHGEENENFQRRTYWMLEEDLSHIALVHYREVKGHKRTNFNNVKEAVPYSNEAEEIARQPELENSVSSSFDPSNYQMRLQATDAISLSNAKASEFEDVESGSCYPYVKMETKRYGLGNQLDIQQILLEAKHRWLRPAEICEILLNYKKFHISSEPATTPPGGSLFLFDRKVLRYFRKDGHNWRKKKDGKTVKEAHERLNVGSVDVLHCYYAHGEENENFQRRSYWVLEEELSHIVLVHYREVKGNRTNFNHAKETVPYSNEVEEIACHSEMENSVSSSFNPSNYHMQSQATDATSLSSAQASEFEDVESAFYNQASSRLQPMTEKINAEFSDAYYPIPFSSDYQEKLSTIPGVDFSTLTQAYKREDSIDAGDTYEPRKDREFALWDDAEISVTDIQSLSFQPSFSATQSDTMGNFSKQENETHGNLFTDSLDKRLVYGIENEPRVQQICQTSEGSLNCLMDSITTKFPEGVDATDLLKSLGPFLMDSDEQNDLQFHLSNADTISKRNYSIEGKADYAPAIMPLLDESFGDNLKKLDSFNRWLSKELEDVDEPQMQSSSGAYWDTVESENEVDESSVPLQVRLDSYMLGPSLSHDQLFSIVDFSPNWAYENSEIKVLITGRFLKVQHAEICKWSCMFGEVEVPAEVIADGVLRCYTPVHKAGRLPFYVTCSNRLACSEVREFEYRVAKTQDVDSKDYYSDCSNETLNMRFGKLLSLSSTSPNCDPISTAVNSDVSSKISSLLKNDNDEWDKMLQLTSTEDCSLERVEEQLLQQLLKEKLHAWLLQKLAGGGKGPSVLDEGGQGVLHFGAALGYDWVLLPTITAGVSVNFRDVNGWTALHWAAFCGRERTVASLLSLGAAPGALTDPTTKYPTGETPADLASERGHKGIAGYLAESALSAHLSSLNLDIKEGNSAEISGAKAVSASSRDGELTDGLSLRNSLTAVCNATQAAARIHQVFRVQSFQRKQLKEYNGDKFGISNERALSLIGVKSHKAGKRDQQVDAAAIRIQNKFRSWKGRKDFLIIRQRIVKIQAHVRGHQVRKNYRKIVWSVGIVEKIILRWRRKGSGLRGFKPEPLPEGPSMQVSSSKDDDYDVLKEGRKQTEERLQKALARVKSMVQYPEARDQYHRLLNVVTEIQETKVLNSSEGTSAYMDDDLADIEALFDDDIFMPTAPS